MHGGRAVHAEYSNIRTFARLSVDIEVAGAGKGDCAGSTTVSTLWRADIFISRGIVNLNGEIGIGFQHHHLVHRNGSSGTPFNRGGHIHGGIVAIRLCAITIVVSKRNFLVVHSRNESVAGSGLCFGNSHNLGIRHGGGKRDAVEGIVSSRSPCPNSGHVFPVFSTANYFRLSRRNEGGNIVHRFKLKSRPVIAQSIRRIPKCQIAIAVVEIFVSCAMLLDVPVAVVVISNVESRSDTITGIILVNHLSAGILLRTCNA